MLMQTMGHKIKIKLKASLNNEWVDTIHCLINITKRIHIIYRKFFCFVHVIYTYPKLSCIRKKLVTIEIAVFSFSGNCSFNNTFSF